MNKCTRIASLGFLFGLALFLVLAIQVQAGPEPPYTPVEAPPLSMGQEMMVQTVAAPAAADSAAHDSAAAPCVGGTCPAITVECNQVVNWVNDRPNQWLTYDTSNPDCQKTSIFPTLPYSETFYEITIDKPDLDLSLAIPKSITIAPGVPMDNFGVILNSCDSDDCRSATHVKQGTIYQHAIVGDAPLRKYTMAIDTPTDVTGSGDAIIACGSHNTGWCESVISTTFQCGNFTFHDNTNNGQDDITYYGTNIAFDGKEMTYKLVLTETRYFSATLHYAGNSLQDYYNYMGLFVLPDTCNQRTLVGYTGLTGEKPAPKTGTTKGWLPAGTYYLVADGTHMPYGGDPFTVDMGCTGLEASKEATDLNGGALHPGDIVEYSIVLRNTGGLELENIGVTDSMPAHTTYVANSAAATPQATITETNPLLATWDSIEAGQTATLTFQVTVNSTAVGWTIANSATVRDPDQPNLLQIGDTIGPVSRLPGDNLVYLPIILKNIK